MKFRPVYLKSDGSVTRAFLKLFLFGETQWAKNQERSTFPAVIRAFIQSIGFCVLIFIFEKLFKLVGFTAPEIDLDSQKMSLGFLTIVLGNFVRFELVYNRRWTYVVGLFNSQFDVLGDTRGSKNKGDDFLYRLKETNFAIDVVYLDMWAQRTVAVAFRTVLLESIALHPNSNVLIIRLEAGKLSEDDVISILSQRSKNLEALLSQGKRYGREHLLPSKKLATRKHLKAVA